MCRYVKKLAWLFCLLITCNLNPTYPNGKSSFAAAYFLRFTPQSSVITDLKSHALYLTIHLNSNASTLECLRSIGRIGKYVDQICPPYICGEHNEILYGVGFGIDFYRKVNPSYRYMGIKNYEYHERNGKFGKLPKTGGDIFVHAKCNNHGMLFDLAKYIIYNMPIGSVAKFEDDYSWMFRNRRDLSEFEDGTMNPKDMHERAKVAINKRTGGSYAVVLKWVHDMELLRRTKVLTLLLLPLLWDSVRRFNLYISIGAWQFELMYTCTKFSVVTDWLGRSFNVISRAISRLSLVVTYSCWE
ncbi:putative deferrochelatase/peroxidase YfeX isoform 2 [Schistosoma japonicum]|uniref:Putative deferrochelatase/peroxidase YfeX isoform 2 n=1 Tax=Schistosoma japonicum TaxID=6182 RepID=A0A4Z2CWZ0_SCHJA|nr:putative deferrochelatase/peroxidase YfeX isoform 2 [Schistosoma japonicum]